MDDGSSPDGIVNPLETHLGYHLRRVSSVVMARLAERLCEVGLTVTEASVLLLIDRNEGLSQSEIGRVLGIQRANMAPIAATLGQRGLIVRDSSAGRAVRLSTTKVGKAAALRCEALMLDNEALSFAAIGEGRFAPLCDLFRPVWDAEKANADSTPSIV